MTRASAAIYEPFSLLKASNESTKKDIERQRERKSKLQQASLHLKPDIIYLPPCDTSIVFQLKHPAVVLDDTLFLEDILACSRRYEPVQKNMRAEDSVKLTLFVPADQPDCQPDTASITHQSQLSNSLLG